MTIGDLKALLASYDDGARPSRSGDPKQSLWDDSQQRLVGMKTAYGVAERMRDPHGVPTQQDGQTNGQPVRPCRQRDRKALQQTGSIHDARSTITLPMATTEPTINVALADLLRKSRRAWAVAGVIRSENTGTVVGQAKPDILIVEPNIPPIVIETEVLPALTVEDDARKRLGLRLRSDDQPIYSSLSVRLPVRLRRLEGDALSSAIRVARDLQFALLQGESASAAPLRWPSSGWLTGGVAELSAVAQQAAIPPKVIDQATEWFVGAISAAAGILEEIATRFPGAMKHICEILHQEDSEQTRRMAMTIVANALIFHETLAGGPGELGEIRPLDAVRNGSGRLSKAKTIAEWERILRINYWPIFDVAKRIVSELPVERASQILEMLAEMGAKLLANRVARSHDITGAVFQKLIYDRKFLAAFYTTPPSATLLANLALRPDHTPRGGAWSKPEDVEAIRIADFACGTGTLLSAAYHRVSQLHELAGGDSSGVHPKMMSDVLVGCDVMPSAAYLTASMLSSVHPDVTYTKSRIITVPYGLQEAGELALGSLDMLKAQGTFSILSTFGRAAGATGEHVADTWESLPRATFDLVVMNPPYTRATGHEGKKVGVPIPMFAAFGTEEEDQRAMSAAFQKLTKGTSAHGNAGEASAFLVLANDKLREGGCLALVMPLSLLAGAAWEKSRQLLRSYYSDLIILSVAGGASEEGSSFSADTGMAECLIVATKARGGTKRATFIVLENRPDHQLKAAELARLVRERIASGELATLEQGPVGGTALDVGDDRQATMIDAPLPSDDGPWSASRIRDFALAQTAWELAANGRVWLPGQASNLRQEIPVTRLGAIAKVGPYHMDINGKEQAGGAVRGPFDVVDLPPGRAPTYPILWAHEAADERSIIVAPDSEGRIRAARTKVERDIIIARAEAIWSTASEVHVNRDFRFNSQSVAVAFTELPSIGGRAWPSVKFTDIAHAKAFTLWSNTTLGLFMYWWVANKQQGGRGSVTVTAIPELPTLDVARLSAKQLNAMTDAFTEASRYSFLPFNEIDADKTRAELDKLVLGDILGLRCAQGTTMSLKLLRQKLSAEPSIAGAKKRIAITEVARAGRGEIT